MFSKSAPWLLMLLLLVPFACGEAPQESSRTALKSARPLQTEMEADRQPDEKGLDLENRKIIKTGDIEFQTSSLSKTRNRINEAINQSEGYISSENESTYDGRVQQRIVIRVPADNFDRLVAAVTQGVGKFDRKHIEARDVTEEFLDITARLRIKKETEKRYLQLLSKANTVKDILAIEKQISELRAEIESIEGRLKYLNDRIAYSTLTVTFYEIVSAPVGFAHKFKLGIQNGWNNFVWFLVGIVNIWPFIILGIMGIVGIRFYIKRKKK